MSARYQPTTLVLLTYLTSGGYYDHVPPPPPPPVSVDATAAGAPNPPRSPGADTGDWAFRAPRPRLPHATGDLVFGGISRVELAGRRGRTAGTPGHHRRQSGEPSDARQTGVQVPELAVTAAVGRLVDWVRAQAGPEERKLCRTGVEDRHVDVERVRIDNGVRERRRRCRAVHQDHVIAGGGCQQSLELRKLIFWIDELFVDEAHEESRLRAAIEVGGENFGAVLDRATAKLPLPSTS